MTLLHLIRRLGLVVRARRERPRLESYRVSREPKMLDGQRPPKWRWRFL
jgi:hypothetical protein